LQKENVMASITLKYNARNKMAQEAIDYVLSLGVFETEFDDVETTHKPNFTTRRAIRAAERGKVIKCDSFDDFVKRMSNA
jgi:hypothetical protein